ncbi:hypothetical protein Tco_1069115, partial [Tanacetum coccineum]
MYDSDSHLSRYRAQLRVSRVDSGLCSSFQDESGRPLPFISLTLRLFLNLYSRHPKQYVAFTMIGVLSMSYAQFQVPFPSWCISSPGVGLVYVICKAHVSSPLIRHTSGLTQPHLGMDYFELAVITLSPLPPCFTDSSNGLLNLASVLSLPPVQRSTTSVVVTARVKVRSSFLEFTTRLIPLEDRSVNDLLAMKLGSSSETMDQAFDRLQKLITQLEIQGEVITQEDMNLKLLRSLPSEWKT